MNKKIKIVKQKKTIVDIETIELLSIVNMFLFNIIKNNQKKQIKNKFKFISYLKNKIVEKNKDILDNDIDKLNHLVNLTGGSIFLTNLSRFQEKNIVEIKMETLYQYCCKIMFLYDECDETKTQIEEYLKYVNIDYHFDENEELPSVFEKYFYSPFSIKHSKYIFNSNDSFLEQITMWCHLLKKIDVAQQVDILKNSILSDTYRYFLYFIEQYKKENKEFYEGLFNVFSKNLKSIKLSSKSIYNNYNTKQFAINESTSYSIDDLLNFIYFINEYYKNLTIN